MALDVLVLQLEAVPQHQERPAHRELAVPRIGEARRPAERVQLRGRRGVVLRRRAAQQVQEVGPLRRRPRPPQLADPRPVGLDAVDRGLAGGDRRVAGGRLGFVRGHARAVEPPREVDLERGPLMHLDEVPDEVLRVDGFVGERPDVGLEERIQSRPLLVLAVPDGVEGVDDGVAHGAQKGEALLVRHVGVRVVGVDPVIDGHAEPREQPAALLGLHQVDLVLEQAPSDPRLEVRERGAVDLVRQPPGGVRREPVVQEALGPGRVRHQRPEVGGGDVVGHGVGERAVPDDHRGRQERQVRVRDAAVREGPGHDDHVEAAPGVGPEHGLGGREVLFGHAPELRFRGFNGRGMRVERRPRPDGPLLQHADGHGDQVRGHGRGHLEPADAPAAFDAFALPLGRGDYVVLVLDSDGRGPGEPLRGNVEAGEERPVRAAPARRVEGRAALLRPEPRRRGPARRAVCDGHVAFNEVVGHLDDDLVADVAPPRLLEVQAHEPPADRLDRHRAVRVEPQLRRFVVRPRLTPFD